MGLVLGLPQGKGLLGTVVLCAGTSHLSGVVPFVKTKDLLNSKQISWYKNLSVYSVFLHVSNKVHLLSNIGKFSLSIFEFTALFSYSDYKHDLFYYGKIHVM